MRFVRQLAASRKFRCRHRTVQSRVNTVWDTEINCRNFTLLECCNHWFSAVPRGYILWAWFIEVLPAAPPWAGTERTFIPLIRAPHADWPIPVRGGEEMAPVYLARNRRRCIRGR